MNKIYWCPVCHKKIVPPAMLAQPNIKILGGAKVTCGHCKRGYASIPSNVSAEERAQA